MIDSLEPIATEYHDDGVNFGTGFEMIAEIKRLREVLQAIQELGSTPFLQCIGDTETLPTMNLRACMRG